MKLKVESFADLTVKTS